MISPMVVHPGRARALLALVALAAGLAVSAPVWAQAQFGGDDQSDWREDAVPAPPAYSTSQLIDLETPAGSSVKLGVDPKTITINQATGIVRYVVVARGPSAVNASYEGIHCATAEYRVYARQTQGNPWITNSDDAWKPMLGQSRVVVSHPSRLARDGMCVGPAVAPNVDSVVRNLRSGNRSIYNY